MPNKRYDYVMNVHTRNSLLIFGSVWGFVLAAIPAITIWENPFVIGPFLAAALISATLSGAIGTLIAGRRAMNYSHVFPAALWISVLQGLVAGTLAGLLIWLEMTINISGFTAATPAKISNLVLKPHLFLESSIVGIAVFVYTLTAAAAFSPIVGSLIYWMVHHQDKPPAEEPTT